MLSRPLLLLFGLPLAWGRSRYAPKPSSGVVVLPWVGLELGQVNVPACALKDYRGTDNEVKWAVYFISSECSSEVFEFGASSFSHALGEEEVPMWLSEMAIDPSVRAQQTQEQNLNYWVHDQQTMSRSLFPWPFPWRVLHHDPASSFALVAIDRSKLSNVDMHIPQSAKLTALSSSPLPPVTSWYKRAKPIPDTSIARITSLIDTLPTTPSPKVLSVLSSLSIGQMRADIRWLTGEDPKSPIVSRHSFTVGAMTTAKWLKEQFEASGAKCDLLDFLEGFAPNVRCRYAPRESDKPQSDEKATVILGAHYDSRGSFGSLRHPGGDDDGSGVISLLAIARAIKRHKITFGRPVELVAFAGEEQGLLGSKFYSSLLRDGSVDVLFMIQADMLAYRAPGEDLQLALPLTIGLPELGRLVGNVAALYSPELVVGTSAACCSDHQSFFEQGYPATQVFERNGPIIDPMYHNTGDLSEREGYSFEQVIGITKVTLATMLHGAQYKLSKE